MNREQMIKRGGNALSRFGVSHYPNALNMAQVVIDAILPQVTTVAELEALPDHTAIANSGDLWQIGYSLLVGRMVRNIAGSQSFSTAGFAAFMESNAPLTVVWAPEVTS